jgi:glycosyltransferase involved in cell wall biosynthesis
MKTLLLTDIQPSSNLTAGIVTAQMCRFVPQGQLAIFCVQNRHLRPELYSDLAHVPIRVVAKPNELNRQSIWKIPIGDLISVTTETMRRLTISPLVREAVEFGRQQNATSVWAVLQGQTMVRMAGAVANRLGVPLHVQVWDPLSWWLRSHGVDRLNRKWDLALFDRTLRQAVACATASGPMASHYQARYGTSSRAIIASLDRSVARRPEPRLRKSNELSIGFAGQLYANDEWLRFVQALECTHWRVAGRKVVVRALGHQRPQGIRDENLDFLGWQTQEKAVDLLSNACDILYCPYPFAASLAEVAKFSFPSKISTYLAAGTPVIFHGPVYSAAALYLKEKRAGLVCDTLGADAVYEAILRLVKDEALYERLARGAQAAFLADFTLDRMEKEVRHFLGYPNSDLVSDQP